MQQKKISTAVIKRLPRYYRYLGELLEKDVVRISSKELSEKMNVTASQIRQDLNNFGGFGQQGYGYNVEYLYMEIGKILGLDRKYNLIIIGGGNIGKALAKYTDFERRNFFVQAIFDVNPELNGKKVRGIPIYMMDTLEQYIKEHTVDIVALAIPKAQTAEVGAELERLGVKAIWNFAPTELMVSKDIIVENVHLTESLMRLSYRLNAEEEL